ncbi:MAG: transcriptional regulator, partial [Acidobacteria bacterium]|nr:transcriptional regulator [Acidobacteriota bacterium]
MSSNPSQINELYEFGPFRLDLLAHLLFREGVPVPLAPKSYDVLVYLVKNPGRAISREDLLTAVWPDTVVSDASLTQAVFLLRKALGDGDEGWIETVPKVGYRFKDAVRQIDRAVETAPPAAEAPPEPVAPIGLSRRRLLAGSALGLLGVGAAAVIFRSRRPAVPQSRPTTPPPSSLLRVERELRVPPDAERILGTTEGTLVFSAPGAYYLQPLDGAVPASRLPLTAGERVADRLVEDDLVVVSGTSVLRRHALKQTDRTLGTVPEEAAANVTRVLVSDSGRHLVLAGPAAVFVFALPQPPDLDQSGRQLTPSAQLRPGVLPGEVLAVSELFLARVAGAGAPLRAFELATGKPILEAPFAELEPHHIAIDDATGRIAVSGAFDSIALFSVEKGARPERIPRRGWTHGMAFVPDVPTLVVSGYGGLSAHRDRPVAELPGVATA